MWLTRAWSCGELWQRVYGQDKAIILEGQRSWNIFSTILPATSWQMTLEWADNSLAFLDSFLQGWLASNQPFFEDTASESQTGGQENGECQRDTRKVVSGMTRLWNCGKCFLKEHVSTCLLVNVCWHTLLANTANKAGVSIVFNMMSLTGNLQSGRKWKNRSKVIGMWMREDLKVLPGDQTLRKFSYEEEQKSAWKTIWSPGRIFLLLNTREIIHICKY